MTGQVRKTAEIVMPTAMAIDEMIRRVRSSARCSRMVISRSWETSVMGGAQRLGDLPQSIVEVVDGVLHGLDPLGVFVGHLESELLFERDDQVHHLQRVGVQVVDERRLGHNFLFADAKLLRDDLAESFLGVLSHRHWSLPAQPAISPGRWLGGRWSCACSATTRPRMPFTNRGEFSLPYSFASSTASLIATPTGIVV